MSDFRKGDLVRFLPDYEDSDEEYIYLLIEDPDGGRVKVVPHNSGLEIPPVQIVRTEWLINLKGE
ncbi:MAG: hypothetical protein KA807_06515 [Prolixibacteraceae bacterium]|jgi:hypothetical protein|nr:hypothetical protein [Prolixibacteraceae bacterium]